MYFILANKKYLFVYGHMQKKNNKILTAEHLQINNGGYSYKMFELPGYK